MKRKISQKGIDLIKLFEGYRGASYKCPSGVWTIGYGHTKGVTAGMVCTREQAESWLKYDLYDAENFVNGYDSLYGWSQGEFDALVSFTFNCGAGNLKKLLKDGNRNRDEICKALPKYNKANGAVLKGLISRRTAELDLFLFGSVDPFYPKYVGESVSIDTVLSAIGADVDYNRTAPTQWQKRIPIAEANGIKLYKGTLKQNLEIINLAKEGRLKKV